MLLGERLCGLDKDNALGCISDAIWSKIMFLENEVAFLEQGVVFSF